MNKISITIENDCLLFSKYNRDIKEVNLNNTNIINTKNLKFTDDYIISNMDLITTFLNLIIIKFKITKVIIKNLDIAEISILLINQLDSIEEIHFLEDIILTYDICSILSKNKNLILVECYNIPEVMFSKFSSGVIKTRCEIVNKSSWLFYNNINTISDIYNKKTVLISKLFTSKDIDDLRYFFENNKCLKRVEFDPYNRINLETTLKLIRNNNFKKVSIIIRENSSTTKEILNDIKFFDKLNKKYGTNIKIKYSKEYKKKNSIKEFGIKTIKWIILLFTIICIVLVLLLKYVEEKNNKNIKNSIKEIDEILEKIEEQKLEEEITEPKEEPDSYYKEYSNIYSELLSLNNDTVGWLTVNNTKINYPVVQAKNNKYYLNHSFDKSYNMLGWVFVDYRNNLDIIDQNTIIYAHSMIDDGLMFTTLKDTLKHSWYDNDNNLIITFSIKGVNYKWEIFSIYTIDNTDDYLYINFSTDDLFDEFINKIKSRSIKNFGVEINHSDKILTLSTCYQNSNHRIVVHAKKYE